MIDPEPYRCLWNAEGDNYLQKLIELREAMAAMPKTKTTFKPRQYVNGGDIICKIEEGTEEFVLLSGGWLMPSLWSGNKRALRIVNPFSQHASSYPAVGVECGCGQVLEKFDNESYDIHTDDCTSDDRRTAWQELQDKRIAECRRGAKLNQDLSDVAFRLGVDETVIRGHLDNRGIVWSELRDVGRMRMAATMQRLREDGESNGDIGRGLGFSKSAVSGYVNGRYDGELPV